MEVMAVAARKKKHEGNGNGDTRAFAVLVEDLRGQFRAFGERLDGFGGRLDGFGERLDGIDERMTAGFARVDDRLDRVEHRLHHVEGELQLVKTATREHGRMLKDMVRRDEVEALVDRAVARSSR
jgi:hypothetical protein